MSRRSWRGARLHSACVCTSIFPQYQGCTRALPTLPPPRPPGLYSRCGDRRCVPRQCSPHQLVCPPSSPTGAPPLQPRSDAGAPHLCHSSACGRVPARGHLCQSGRVGPRPARTRSAPRQGGCSRRRRRANTRCLTLVSPSHSSSVHSRPHHNRQRDARHLYPSLSRGEGGRFFSEGEGRSFAPSRPTAAAGAFCLPREMWKPQHRRSPTSFARAREGSVRIREGTSANGMCAQDVSIESVWKNRDVSVIEPPVLQGGCQACSN